MLVTFGRANGARRASSCAVVAECARPCLTRYARCITVALGVSLWLAASPDAGAQQPLNVRGTLVRQTLGGVQPVANTRVTLHRVNSRQAGAIDSIMSDVRGGFAFRVRDPDSTSMYLTSARYSGIAYFSPPAQAGQPNAPARIVVYDTTSADVRLQLQGRHFVVSAPSVSGVRSVIDVLEIENDTVLTRVPGAGNRATYSVLLPDGVRGVRESQGEIGDGAVESRNGRAELFAPLSPGLRQLVLTYELAPDVFPLAIPLERSVAVLEVLLEEPGATADGAGLADKGSVVVDGKTFRRYLGASTSANAVLTLGVAAGSGRTATPAWLLPLGLTLVTLGALLAFARRQPGSRSRAIDEHRARPESPRTASMPAASGRLDSATRLACRVAAVDATLDGTPAPNDAARRDLQQYRALMKGELVRVLAERTTPR